MIRRGYLMIGNFFLDASRFIIRLSIPRLWNTGVVEHQATRRVSLVEWLLNINQLDIDKSSRWWAGLTAAVQTGLKPKKLRGVGAKWTYNFYIVWDGKTDLANQISFKNIQNFFIKLIIILLKFSLMKKMYNNLSRDWDKVVNNGWIMNIIYSLRL